MSRRYAALIGTSPSATDRAITAGAEFGMTCVFQSTWLTVLADAKVRVTIPRDMSGIVLGDVFTSTFDDGRHAAARLAALDELPANFWGGYIGFAQAPEGCSVLRGVSGPNPCYFTPLEDGWGFASEARLLSQIAGQSFSVDWQALGSLLLYRESRPEQTCLSGVRELLPGTLATIGANGFDVRPIWTPAAHVAAKSGAFDASVQKLRNTVLATIRAWAQQFERPLLELSGGLDSSIVAAGLVSAASRFHCLSYQASGADLDETDYARCVADHLGASLEKVRPDASAVRLDMSAAAHLPRPHARSFIQETDRLSQEAASRIGADVFFTGNGGDNVFCFLSSIAPVRDRLRSFDIAGSWRTAADIAQVCEVGRWEVLAKTVRRRFRSSAAQEWHWTPDFLADEMVAGACRPPTHPWLAACDRAAPGSRAHVAAILRIQNYLEGHARLAHAPLIAPLLSQPVIETCLSIPSWQWCAGGQNRAVARAAFADHLPGEILERQSKGSFAGMISRILELRRDQVRKMLLDGLLAKHGLVDCKTIEQQLAPASPVPGRSAGRLLGLVDAEAWARSWPS